MAEKEATVYIVDVGRSMGKKRNGRDETDLDWAMRYVWDKITTTVATGRKTANLGVLALGTDDTINELADEDGYQHISVVQPISQILMPDLRRLREVIKPSATDDRDAISALILAVSMIEKHCKKLKWKRRIVLVTNASGHMDPDESNLQAVAAKVKDDDIELVVIGLDFDDPDYGFKEEHKSPIKAANETLLSDLVERCGGVYGTMAQAIEELAMPRVKTTRPVHSYRGQLRLGDPAQYDTALCIDVERYPRTHVARPPPASSYALKMESGGEAESLGSPSTMRDEKSHQQPSTGLEVVRSNYSYQVTDENEPGGKRDVDREQLAKGYEYGRTAVHISESDQNITKLETEAAMEILGFVPKDKYERYLSLDVSNIIVAQRTNDKAILALSSFIHALFELESYAIARLVTKDMKEPILTILSASATEDYECLIENQLPFAEDIRSYRFPPLDKIVTVSGKLLTQHRNLPSDDLMTAMSDFVDQMDLSTFGTDDDGEPAEYMALEDTFSPVLHRIEQAKRWRAVHPTDPIPPVPEILVKYSQQPADLQAQSRAALQKLMKAADVKKVPPKTKGRKRNREMDKPLSGLNVEDLFRKEKRTKISTDNAIPEFKQMLAVSENLEVVKDAVNQMAVIIENQIRHSLGDSAYNRAVEGLGVMRQELVELEEPALYNDMIRELKRKILAEELDGNRKEMWYFIRKNRMGLIDRKLSNLSSVSEEEASAFLTEK